MHKKSYRAFPSVDFLMHYEIGLKMHITERQLSLHVWYGARSIIEVLFGPHAFRILNVSVSDRTTGYD